MAEDKRRYLKDIQRDVTKYAEVIASVLKLDVEIVDDTMERIAGTGIFHKRVNSKSPGLVYSNVLKTGVQRIVQFPREDEICRYCDAKGTCLETLEVSSPIKYRGANIGVIGLVCTTLEQRDYINSNLESHTDFVKQMSSLISAKVSEHITAEENLNGIRMLRKILDDVENGVIVINKDNQIVYINRKAGLKFRFLENTLGHHLTLQEGSGDSEDGLEYKLEVDGKSYSVLGKVLRLGGLYRDYDRIIIFRTLKDIKQTAYRITQESRLITSDNIVGESAGMKEIKATILKVAGNDSTVFIRGESGTGKELIARAIHAASHRREEPFIGINCAAIPDTLLESELFGYVKGAFSGASASGRIGKFELANKGTLFLDEIGDMPLYLQSQVLRILQERTFTRIGSNELRELDIRVITATNRDIEEMIRKNQFRRDLFYRINVIPINVPPLRDRADDMVELFKTFLAKYNALFDKHVTVIEPEVMEIFRQYPWPGNVRELENVTQYLITIADAGRITKGMIAEDILKQTAEQLPKPQAEDAPRSFQTLQAMADGEIERAVAYFGNTTEGKKQAAKALGIGIATLYRRLGMLSK